MAKSPTISERARVDLIFDLGGQEVDAGDVCTQFGFTAMRNGGYVINGVLSDPNFNVIRRLLIGAQYLRRARTQVFKCRFRLRWVGPAVQNQTEFQTAYVVAMRPSGTRSDAASVEFVAIDPPSYLLNTGDASGRAYRGKVSDVIRRCVQEYAPNIDLEISETSDSPYNVYYMMSLDPKNFIGSLLDWSCALTASKTAWLVSMDDVKMRIMAQAEIKSENVAYYPGPRGGQEAGQIINWELLADSALAIMNTKLVTQGASATTGQYLNSSVDQHDLFVVVDDSNTPNKYKARTSANNAFSKPPEGDPPQSGMAGWTNIVAVPEMYSGGEIGKTYQEYVDGRARALYLGMTDLVMRARIRVPGHGIYSSCYGLGTDTITLRWLDVDGTPFFMSGNWLLYGFEHKFRKNAWTTDLYCARFDYDAVGKPVPELPAA